MPPAADVTQDEPRVSNVDVLGDSSWFDERPDRRYRLRRGTDGQIWAIRRRARGIFLRTTVTAGQECPDTERAAKLVWWRSARPELTPQARADLMKASRSGRLTKPTGGRT